MSPFTGLTPELCQRAFELILPTIKQMADDGVTDKFAGWLVVLDPAKPFAPLYRDAIKDDVFHELVLWEDRIGMHVDYDLDTYQDIAYAKAFTSYLTGLPSHEVQQVAPMLYVPGMTKWGGSAVYGSGPMRLIVAYSGLQWNFDQMISEMMISALKALCLQEMRAVMATDEAMILDR